MAEYTQTDRAMSATTPLGEDVMLLAGFTGTEGISQLFQYQLDVLVEHTKKGEKPIPKEVAFDQIIGQSITVKMILADGETAYHNGVCVRATHGEMDDDFTSYQLELVPKLWLLTRIARSRIFQHISVPDILAEVLTGMTVDYRLQGTYEPRDYCVQFRETDFNFACRVMEEEGIYFYFAHEDGDHKLIVADAPSEHDDVPGATEIIYENWEGGSREEDRIFDWSKKQELRSGKYNLWDYCFEKTDSNLEATAEILSTVDAGTITHKLAVADNSSYEIYDFPGEYAQRFDGIDKGGGEQASEIEKIFQDNARTVGIRMQQEALPSLLINGASNVRYLVAGHKFSLTEHVHADGEYVLTRVTHSASETSYRQEDGGFNYNNGFQCIPAALPFRPPRVTPKPVVSGTQTAVVVGPDGEEIFTDKYSRVKVQFHWHREGEKNADSSCWIRVTTLWAGTQWGMIHIPRIGQEVIVDFLEGDPDQPIIVGSVYNASNMPPYELPDNRTQSGIKSRSSLEGTEENFNEIRFEDKKGEEEVYFHAEKDMNTEIENDESRKVGRDRKKSIERNETTSIGSNRTETVGKNEEISIGENRTETVGKDETITISGQRSETVEKDETITINGKRTEQVKEDETISVGGNRERTVDQEETITVEQDRTVTVNANQTVNVGEKLQIEAGDEIVLKTGDASITMKSDGKIEIKGGKITIQGSDKINVKSSSDVVIKGSNVKEN